MFVCRNIITVHLFYRAEYVSANARGLNFLLILGQKWFINEASWWATPIPNNDIRRQVKILWKFLVFYNRFYSRYWKTQGWIFQNSFFLFTIKRRGFAVLPNEYYIYFYSTNRIPKPRRLCPESPGIAEVSTNHVL